MRRVLVLGAVIALAGCGGGGGSSQSPEDQVRSTVQQFATDVAAGENGRACERSTDPTTCVRQLVQASLLLGEQSTRDLFKDPQIQRVKVAADGKSATTMVKGYDSPTKLVKRGARWLVDTDDDSTDISTSGPDRAAVAQWPAAWCSLDPVSTRAEVRAQMGTPTASFPDSDQWSAFGYGFNAFYDENEHVRQLDWNPVGSSKGQRAKITCAETRRP